MRIDDVKMGTLRYCGSVHHKFGEWAGVELDIPSGSNNGSTGCVRYFRCNEGCGEFVEVSSLQIANETPLTLDGSLSQPEFGPRWDMDGVACSVCGDSFSISRRKHHCRNCGSLCCQRCSPHRYLLFLFVLHCYFVLAGLFLHIGI